MTLHYYFARRYAAAFIGVFTTIFLVLALVDLVEQGRRFDGSDASFGNVVVLTLLNVPESAYRVLPLVAILSAIALFVALSRSSEMVVARASGRSALTCILSPVCIAILFGTLGVAIMNPIVAATSKQFDALADRLLDTRSSVLSVGPEGLWLRDGDATGQTVIRAARANFDATRLTQVTFLEFDADGLPSRRLEADRAALRAGSWELSDVKLWSFAGTVNPEAEATVESTYILPTELTREKISDSFGTPSAIPIWELPAFIQQLETAGFSARQHRVWLQMELAMPLLLGAMVLVAAGFTLRPARFGQTGLMVMLALLLGFTLYFVRNFSQILGENGQIPVALAAWGPTVATLLLPLGLLLHLEDG
ncbi:MAG: LPS export ABC transporter permease LptG [Pseudomonadota bacterium]